MLGASAAEALERTGWARSVGGVGPYRQLCADVAAKGYEGFALTGQGA